MFGIPYPSFLGPEPPPEAEALGDHFRKAWTAVATTGDPGWTAYDMQQRTTKIFDVEPKVAAYPEETAMRLWQDHRFQALPLLSP